jgi:Flp pilus assembly protein TadD
MKERKTIFRHSVVRVTIFICLVCFAPQIFAQQTRNSSSISGFVYDSKRNPVVQIPVELMNEVNSVIQRTRTDGSGRFSFNGISTGRFTVRVLPLGTNFEEQTKEVELTGTGALGRPISDFAQIEFYLRPRKTENETVTGVVFAQDIPADARKLYEKAVSSIDQNKFDEGAQELESALTIFPTYYLALEKLGALYLNQKQYEKARDNYNKAVAVNSRSFNSWYGLCYTNYILKNSASAVEAAQKAVSINPGSVEATLFLGISFRQAKKYEDAEKTLKQVNKLTEGKSPDAHWNLALLYAYNLKRYNDAASELELYLQVTPDAADAENIRKLIKFFREKSTQPN